MYNPHIDIAIGGHLGDVVEMSVLFPRSARAYAYKVPLQCIF